MTQGLEPASVDRVLTWLYREELRRSRMIWRFGSDRRADPPWPYDDLWFDPAGAVLVDMSHHPTLGGGLPWFQACADDADAMELLFALRLPPQAEVLADMELRPLLERLGEVESSGTLAVYALEPSHVATAALPYEVTRLTLRHRSLVVDDDWRPEDLADEVDEEREGVRYAILRDGQIASRLLVQPVSEHVVEVADLHTRPDCRRRGYGAALVQGVVRRLHKRGLTVTYSVHPSNTPSVQLARALGFHEAFTWERYLLSRA